MEKVAVIGLAILTLGFFSCKESSKNEKTLEDIEITNETSQPNSIVKKIDDCEIRQSGFMGLEIGEEIASNPQNLKKDIQENGEGSFSGYTILNKEGEKIGFVFPNAKDSATIGIIEISSPNYTTEKDIKIGSTYEELKNAYPNIETHGSEIEGRTHAIAGNLWLRLDAYFTTYNIDELKIKPNTKIKKILIVE